MATTPEHAPHIPHLRLPDIRGGFRWAKDNSLTLGLALAIAAGGTYFIASHDQKPPIKPTTGVSDTFKPPESEFVVVPAIPTPTEVPPTATASPTPEPPKPTATLEPTKVLPTPTEATAGAGSTPPPKEEPPTSEAKKDAPCAILPQEYCSKAELIYTKNSSGQSEIYIGFHLPPNVPIFAGMDGQTGKAVIAQPSEFKGNEVIIRDPNLSNPDAISFDIIGDLRFDNMLSTNVKEGDIIGYTQDTGVKNLGDYNFLVTVRQRTPSGPIPAEDILKKRFQSAFTKPAKTLSYEGPNNPASTILSPVFASGK